MMKKTVELSSYCWIISSLTIALICGIFAYIWERADNQWALIIFGIAIAVLILSASFFMPLSISFDGKNLNINRFWCAKRIPLVNIADVKICPPTMGEKRIFGSGGFFGWYGWFSEADLGKYFAYYGKASDCFLVTLKNGRKYMLGCADAPAMVAEIRSNIC